MQTMGSYPGWRPRRLRFPAPACRSWLCPAILSSYSRASRLRSYRRSLALRGRCFMTTCQADHPDGGLGEISEKAGPLVIRRIRAGAGAHHDAIHRTPHQDPFFWRSFSGSGGENGLLCAGSPQATEQARFFAGPSSMSADMPESPLWVSPEGAENFASPAGFIPLAAENPDRPGEI